VSRLGGVFALEGKRVSVLVRPLGRAQLWKAAGLAGVCGDAARAAFSKTALGGHNSSWCCPQPGERAASPGSGERGCARGSGVFVPRQPARISLPRRSLCCAWQRVCGEQLMGDRWSGSPGAQQVTEGHV